jgi:hypothetical protein
VPGSEEMGTPDTEFPDEKKVMDDDEPSYTDELPLLEKTRKRDHSDETTEYGEPQIPRLCSTIFLRTPADPPPSILGSIKLPHLYLSPLFTNRTTISRCCDTDTLLRDDLSYDTDVTTVGTKRWVEHE